ncbi:MAG: DUF4145 domain-containing protein, partial [Chloroflexi bacterium]|nr:DUF4145 domain-containing protein [Chloroflexota bacterium]
MADEYFPPSFRADAFHCPHCGVYSHQHFSNPDLINVTHGGNFPLLKLKPSTCERCQNFCLWIGNALIYPDHGGAPHPNQDLPDDSIADYEEAAAVLNKSPRAAAALLRLAIQKICDHLDPRKGDVNAKIKDLTGKGLRVEIQQALDTVRVVGNHAVHPGQMDLKDDRVTCMALFGL